MQETHDEEQLWELSRAVDDRDPVGDRVEVGDRDLAAWRRGELSEGEAVRVEGAIAHDRSVRGRLVELAGLAPSSPSALQRARFLRAFSRRAWMRRRGRRWLAAAAAVALVSGATWWGVGRGGRAPVPLPPELAYTVTLEGLATARSAAPGAVAGDPAKVYRTTPLELLVEPRDDAVADVDFALYVAPPVPVDGVGDAAEGSGRVRELTRRRPGSGLELEIYRGSATFRGLAGDVLGAAPGRYRLIVVVSRRSDLPERLPWPDPDSPPWTDDPTVRVVPLDLDLLEAPEETG